MKYIEVNDVSKVYKDASCKVHALDSVSLKLDKGDYAAFVGASGAGKSTLLHLLGALDNPSSGTVIVDGKDVSKLNNRELFRFRNQKVGFVFQFYYLLHEMTALENVMLPSVIAKNSFKAAKEQACNLLSDLGLSERLNFYPHQMSGGEQQRVALARALINDPELLLCDEPTGNLDPESTDKIRTLLSDLSMNKGKTVLLVTHNLELAKDAKTVFNIKKGKIIDNI